VGCGLKQSIHRVTTDNQGVLYNSNYIGLLADNPLRVGIYSNCGYAYTLNTAVGSRAASIKRPLLSVDVSVYVCVCLDAKYLGN